MAERFEIVQKALVKMLEDKKYATLRDILVTMNPSDIAGLFEDLEEKQIPLMFRLLTKEQAAETFVEMEPEEQEALIRGISDSELKQVMDELYVAAKEMGGEVSGEHGIGHAKKGFLAESVGEAQVRLMQGIKAAFDPNDRQLTRLQRAELIAKLEKEMKEAAKMLEFEVAAALRDQIIQLRGKEK